MRQAEYVVTHATAIRMVNRGREVGLMIEQSIDDVRGFAMTGGQPGVEGHVWTPPLPPIIFPGRPERWWGDEALKAETDAPQATLEQRHQAAGDVLALRCRGFFSGGAFF